MQQGTGLQVDAQAAGTGGDEEHLDLQGQGDKLGAAAFDVLLALLEPAPSRILLQAVILSQSAAFGSAAVWQAIQCGELIPCSRRR